MDENHSIHSFDFNMICEYFASLRRQGPGSEEATFRALGFIDNLTADSKIADIGCGTGGQTLTLAKHAPAKEIIGIDLFPKFIDIFNANARQAGFDGRMKGIVGSMEELPFADEEFDVLWSEGAIYNIGFKRGMQEWRKFLKCGGYIVVSEVSWLTDNRPKEIEDFWQDAYAEIDTVSVKVAQMQAAGYVPVATFLLSDNCWTENFYKPQTVAQELFLKKYAGNETAEQFVANQRREAAIYAKYKDYYGYVFYIGKKIRK